MNSSSGSKGKVFAGQMQPLRSPSNSSNSNFATPPTFEQSYAPIHSLVERNLHDEDATAARSLGGDDPHPLLPPDYSEYQAEYFTGSDGNAVSPDKHLNENCTYRPASCRPPSPQDRHPSGEAFYRFLLSQASTRPPHFLQCKASHKVKRFRVNTHEKDGNPISSVNTYTESIVDFDFTTMRLMPSYPPHRLVHLYDSLVTQMRRIAAGGNLKSIVSL
ncbi:hypothetical protein FRB97_005708 [Tulasnella sp. 331]|nr:hypothetical protein FRB97_005708 [Tulasnella sp. 331]